MKIKSISHHDMSTKEFKGFTKVSQKFGAWRQVSKTINFGVLFGCTAPTLAVQLENAGYKVEEAVEYIHNVHAEQLFTKMMEEKRGKMKKDKIIFFTAATLMLEAYYKAYPGVKIRAERETNFAWMHGYAQNWHGTVRHLPELRFMKRNSRGDVMGADKKLFSSMVSNRQNQAGNSPIQAMESRIAVANIVNIFNYIDEWGLKTHLWNMVHDSCDFIVYKPEADLISSLVEATSTWHRDPEFGVYMKMDFAWCDPAHGAQNNLYHGGIENPWKVLPIEEAVAKWNEDHKDVKGFKPISWHGCSI